MTMIANVKSVGQAAKNAQQKMMISVSPAMMGSIPTRKGNAANAQKFVKLAMLTDNAQN